MPQKQVSGWLFLAISGCLVAINLLAWFLVRFRGALESEKPVREALGFELVQLEAQLEEVSFFLAMTLVLGCLAWFFVHTMRASREEARMRQAADLESFLRNQALQAQDAQNSPAMGSTDQQAPALLNSGLALRPAQAGEPPRPR